MPEAWVITRSSIPGTAPATSCTSAPLDIGITIGRHAEMPLGVDVPDEGISRVALTITATAEGWAITNRSRNGIIRHPLGTRHASSNCHAAAPLAADCAPCTWHPSRRPSRGAP